MRDRTSHRDTQRRHDGFPLASASAAVYSSGWLWTEWAFVAPEAAWWNSLVVGLAIFSTAGYLAWRALPNIVGGVMLVLSVGTVVLFSIAFGSSLF
jgi:hypothetical protein